MSTLSSASTDAQRYAAYYDNAGYAEDASTTKAAAFETAVNHLLLRPERIRVGNEEIQLSHLTMRSQLQDVRRWLAVNGAVGAVKHVDMTNFRS